MVRGAGGTSGGVGTFFLGLALAVSGLVLLFGKIVVRMDHWYIWGYDASGVILVLFLLGMGLLFFRGKSTAGWLLLIASLLGLVLHILLHLRFDLPGTSLLAMLIMLGMVGAGVGLVFRSLGPARRR